MGVCVCVGSEGSRLVALAPALDGGGRLCARELLLEPAEPPLRRQPVRGRGGVGAGRSTGRRARGPGLGVDGGLGVGLGVGVAHCSSIAPACASESTPFETLSVESRSARSAFRLLACGAGRTRPPPRSYTVGIDGSEREPGPCSFGCGATDAPPSSCLFPGRLSTYLRPRDQSRYSVSEEMRNRVRASDGPTARSCSTSAGSPSREVAYAGCMPTIKNVFAARATPSRNRHQPTQVWSPWAGPGAHRFGREARGGRGQGRGGGQHVQVWLQVSEFERDALPGKALMTMFFILGLCASTAFVASPARAPAARSPARTGEPAARFSWVPPAHVSVYARGRGNPVADDESLSLVGRAEAAVRAGVPLIKPESVEEAGRTLQLGSDVAPLVGALREMRDAKADDLAAPQYNLHDGSAIPAATARGGLRDDPGPVLEEEDEVWWDLSIAEKLKSALPLKVQAWLGQPSSLQLPPP